MSDTNERQHAESVWDARPLNDQLREACSAVLHGAFWSGFNGPQGVSKDEALDYAVKLATWVQGVLDKSAALNDGKMWAGAKNQPGLRFDADGSLPNLDAVLDDYRRVARRAQHLIGNPDDAVRNVGEGCNYCAHKRSCVLAPEAPETPF